MTTLWRSKAEELGEQEESSAGKGVNFPYGRKKES
jgi:hypothetical protein